MFSTTVTIESGGKLYDIVDFRVPQRSDYYVSRAHGGAVTGGPLRTEGYDDKGWFAGQEERIIVVPVHEHKFTCDCGESC